MKGNNSYDRDLPQDFLEAEAATSRHAARNILGLLQQREHIRRARKEALRAQRIEAHDIF